MLVQSHTGEIHLLPALPSAWPTGRVRGLRARGAVTVDIDWKAGQIEQATLTARQDRSVRVRIGSKVTQHRLRAGVPIVVR